MEHRRSLKTADWRHSAALLICFFSLVGLVDTASLKEAFKIVAGVKLHSLNISSIVPCILSHLEEIRCFLRITSCILAMHFLPIFAAVGIFDHYPQPAYRFGARRFLLPFFGIECLS